MALSFSGLGTFSDIDADGTIPLAGIVSPTSGVIFLCFDNYAGTPQNPSSVTGLGGTWSQVAVINTWVSNIAMHVWRGVGCSGTGTVTINIGNSPNAVDVHVVGVEGCNTSTPVVQSATNSGTGTGVGQITASASLGAFADAGNGVLCWVCCDDRNGDPVAGSGFTELYDTDRGSWGANRYFTQYRTTNDTTPDCTVGQNGSTDAWGMIAIEIAVAGGAVNTQTLSDVVVVLDEPLDYVFANRRLEDSIVVSEGDTIVWTLYNLEVSDSATVIDGLVRYVRYARLLQDAIAITDELISSVIANLIFTSVLSSSVTVIDEAIGYRFFNRMLDSNLLTTDQALRALFVVRDLMDAVDVYDDGLTSAQRFILLSDVLSVDDSIDSTVVRDRLFNPLIRIGFDQPRIDVGGYAL